MEQRLNTRLVEMIKALDGAIQLEVEAPDSGGRTALDRVEALCRQLSEEKGLVSELLNASETSDLLWQVRSRAGRLKMLIDCAAYFYAGLLSPQISGMDYNARGEWKGQAPNRLIRIRC